jgi:hypothetical protein
MAQANQRHDCFFIVVAVDTADDCIFYVPDSLRRTAKEAREAFAEKPLTSAQKTRWLLHRVDYVRLVGMGEAKEG